jgi:CelD/BcsL family acetyltransferase involved in cellulose biosynthesis
MNPSPRDPCTVDVLPWREWPSVAPHWAELAAGAQVESPFLAPDWVATWLEVYGPSLVPDLVVFRGEGEIVASCLLVTRRRRLPLGWLYSVHVNTAGENPEDEVRVEYNDIPCRAGWEARVAAGLREHLRQRTWDDLMLDGFQLSPVLDAVRLTFGDCRQEWHREPSHFVSFVALRDRGIGFVDSLSAKTRKQIRRSRRFLEERGALEIREPQTTEAALTALNLLAELHQERWTRRSQPGAFASEAFRRFHRELVGRWFEHRRIQIVEVTSGGAPLGLTYSLLANGRAFFYQAGLRLEDGNRLSPGLVTVAAAIESSQKAGLLEFDLLAGVESYKASLGRECRELTWGRISRPGPKMRFLHFLRHARRALSPRPAAGAITTGSDEPNE